VWYNIYVEYSTITLLGEPKSTSHIYKMTCRGRFASMYMSKDGKTIKDSYIRQASSQWHSMPLDNDLDIDLKIYFGTRRKADIDNFNKLSFDALTGIVWEDDSQIKRMTIEKLYDKETPRIEIHIKSYENTRANS